MIVAYLIILIALLLAAKARYGEDSEAYLSRDTTNIVKGFFILMVFNSHICDYWSCLNPVGKYLGQMIVVPFLFYSGYGVMEAIKQKGVDYVKGMPRHRILSTLLNFDVAVCVFAAVSFLLSRELTLKSLILSLITWESIGNSNWYIGVILIWYGVTWLVFRFLPRREHSPRCGWQLGVILVTGVILTVWLKSNRPACWYNTFLCYYFGVAYSVWQDKIKILWLRWWGLVMVFGVIGYLAATALMGNCHGLFTLVRPFFFMIILLGLTWRITFTSPILKWCGEHLFPIYIYQRIPMILIASLASFLPNEFPIVYYFICLMITMFVAWLYRWWRISL